MADVRIQQYPQKSIVSDNDIFLIADSNDVDVNGFLKYKKVRAKDLPSIVNTAESITYANLIASIAADDLIIGTFYKITDSTSGVSPLLVQAVGIDAIGYLAFDAANPLVTINYDVITDTIRWSLNQTVAPISLGSLSATTPLSYNNTTGVFTISQSNTTTNGYLSSADWNTFTAKQNALSGTGIVKSTGGTISYLTDNSTNWNTAYSDSIVSAGVTGTSTKTLTLNQQDGGTVTASWSDADTGLTSVGLSMPSAFTVTNSPLTSNGTLAVTGAGVASQYVRGDGTLAAFPTSTGGGSSVSYYFNGGTSQGTIGGNTYYEMSTTAVIGVGADFNINTNGYVAQFVTDANDPALLTIPAGNWNFEMWFSASSGGGSPSFYLELYKYDGATLTLISSGSAVPESITGGTAIDLYTTALAVPTTALTVTDRLAVRVFVNNSSRTITLHTQNGHLCQAITTFSTGLTALNGLTNQVQTFATGTSGTDFGISSATSTHTFNLPTASASNRGALSSADWTTFNNKQNALTNPITGTGTTNYLPKFTGASALGNSLIFDNGTNVGINTIRFDWFAYGNFGGGSISQKSAVFAGNSYVGSQAGTNISGINFGVNNTTDSPTIISRILGVTTSTTNNAEAGYLAFYTKTGSTSIASQEQMRLDASGQLLIGTTTSSTFKLDVVGTSRVSGNATFLANVNLTSNGSQFQNTFGGVTTSRFFTDAGGGVLSVDGANNFSIRYGGVSGTNFVSFAGATGAATFTADATINGVKVGRGAGSIATNTAVGASALNANTTGATNTAVGVNALTVNTTGSQNTSVGVSSLSANNTGSQNTAIGRAALFTNTTGSNNTGLGYQALYFNSVGLNNTALGAAALLNNTASNNTAVGFEAATTNTSGTNITAIGYQSLKASTGGNNTAVGFQTLLVNSTGTNNTALGDRALTANTTGITNTAIGQAALFTNIVGNNNTAVGTSALFTNTGSANTAVGSSALLNNTASNNTAVGFEAASTNISGVEITAVGYRALKANTGSSNTAIGFNSLSLNTTGVNNTAVGDVALSLNTVASNNSALGYNTQTGNFSGSVILGKDAIATAANQFVVGSTGTNAGAVVTETNVSSKVWNVIINGVAQKILLA
jgi:hypothetical protein